MTRHFLFGTVRFVLPVFFCGALVGCASSPPTSTTIGLAERANAIAASRLATSVPVVHREADAAVRGSSTTGSSRSLSRVFDVPAFRLAASATASASDDAQALATDDALTESAEAGIGPLPGFRETLTRDLKNTPSELWSDTKAVYGNPWNVVFLLSAGGASAALRPEVDDDIEDYYDKHHSLKEDWRDAFGAAGNQGTHFALAGLWYLVGQQFQDVKTYETSKRMFSALTITGLSTMFLKVAANTESPNGENLAWPSGHVSSTMAMATVLNHAYGPLVGIPMFGLTGLVGLERLDSGEHHFSDLVFGAALGWVVAETVMKEHPPELLSGQLVPYVDPVGQNAGIAWVKTLGP